MSNNIRVLKFGGTSVGSHKGRENIVRLALSGDGRTVVVVSALGGVTDLLVSLTTDRKNPEIIEAIESRHREAIAQSIAENRQASVQIECDKVLEILHNPQATHNDIVAVGERLSSIILSQMIECASHLDSVSMFKTTPYFARHIIDFATTNTLIKTAFEKVSNNKVVVIGGFISSDRDSGLVTNLGRGGSDYTAAIVAAALGADELYIYTDVDGFLSADPRIVPGAILIEQLGFVEAMELCNFGAKVVYPPTIAPAYNAEIPIVIRNTYNDTCKGTIISKIEYFTGDATIFKGISSINDTSLLRVRGRGIAGFNYRLFRALSQSGISIYLVSSEEEGALTNIAIRGGDDSAKAVEIFREEFKESLEAVEVINNLAIVAVVGSALSGNIEITAQLYATLEEAGINVITSGVGGGQGSIALVTELVSLRRATKILHESLFCSRYDELNLYIDGDGELYTELMEMIETQRRKFIERHALKINLVDDITEWEERCQGANSVFVDLGKGAGRCMGLDYKVLLESGRSVVSANLEQVSKYGVELNNGRFAYGGCTGRGVPIIRVLNDLKRSGDKITRVLFAIDQSCFDNTLQELSIIALTLGFELPTYEIERCKDGLVAELCIFDDGLTGRRTTTELEGKVTGKIVALSNLNADYQRALNANCDVFLIESHRYREFPLQLYRTAPSTAQSIAQEVLSDILSLRNH